MQFMNKYVSFVSDEIFLEEVKKVTTFLLDEGTITETTVTTPTGETPGYEYSGEDGKKSTALDGVSFSVNKWELISILGHNGSGKSTLAKLLN